MERGHGSSPGLEGAGLRLWLGLHGKGRVVEHQGLQGSGLGWLLGKRGRTPWFYCTAVYLKIAVFVLYNEFYSNQRDVR